MCKKNKLAVEKLSADTVANKTKTPFLRIYTVVLNINASGKSKQESKRERFKKGIPYLVWATDITKGSIKIREIIGCGAPIEVQATDCKFTHSDTIELNGCQYKEKMINGVYHYIETKKLARL